MASLTVGDAPMTSIILSLDPIRLHLVDGDDPWDIACAGCRDQLQIHQPDDRLHTRLLGTCPSCLAWYLIEADAAVMVRLPDEDALRDP
jgi:hypothetical protein